MSTFDFCIELLATFTESLLVLTAVPEAAGKKYHGKKLFLMISGAAVVMTALVTLFNSIDAFSFFTMYFGIVFVILSTKLLSTGHIFSRATATMIVLFVMFILEYITTFTLGIFFGPYDNISEIFYKLMTPGILRIVFLLIVKVVQLVIFLLSRKALRKIADLSKKHCLILFGITVALYFIMIALLQSILEGDSYFPQLVAVLTWFFILVCLMLAVTVFVIISGYQTAKTNYRYLQQTNALMMENYTEIHRRQQEYAKLTHDFKHHLLAIKQLRKEGKQEELDAYLDSLLEVSYRDGLLCHSGNDIIDAVINFKAKEAEREGIDFAFAANFQKGTSIAPTDLCSLLANQIENALEACRKIPEGREKRIFVQVRQEGDFAVFTVENTVESDPFKGNPHLHTTK